MNLSSIIDWMDLLIFVLAILGTIGVIYAGIQLYQEEEKSIEPSPTTKNKHQQTFPPENKASISVKEKSKKTVKKSSPEKLVADPFVDKVLEQALEDELAAKGKTKTKAPKPAPPITKTTPKTSSKAPKITPTEIAKNTSKDSIKKPEPKSPASPKKSPINTEKNTSTKKSGFANLEEPKKKKSIFSFWKKDKGQNKAELLGQIMPPANEAKAPKKQILPAPELIAEKLTLRSPESINLTLKVKGNKLVYRKLSHGSYNELRINHQPTLNRNEARRNEYPTGNSLTFSINGENVISKTYQFTIYFGDMAGNVFSQQVAGLGKEYPIVDKPQKVL